MASILFICKGNICRSPAAEIILKNLRPDWFVFSVASTPNTVGQKIHPQIVNELRARGYTIPDKQRPVYNIDDILSYITEFDQIHDLHAEGIQDPYITLRYGDAIDEIEDYIKNIILEQSQ
jgi:protein-tyrosine phosphatase